MSAATLKVDRSAPLPLANVVGLLFGVASIRPIMLWASNPEEPVDVPVVLGAALVVLAVAALATRFWQVRRPEQLLAIQLAVIGFWNWSELQSFFPSTGWLEMIAGFAFLALLAGDGAAPSARFRGCHS